MTRHVFLTGRPGVGKTSVLLRIVNALKDQGLRVGGMISQEARTGARARRDTSHAKHEDSHRNSPLSST
jgi:nucleoside-triphosphatase THEP1